MERYLAICHPLYQYAMAGFSRAIKIVALVWVISFLSALPYAFFTQLNYIDRPLGSGLFLQQSAFCALLDANISPKVVLQVNFMDIDFYDLMLLGLPLAPGVLPPLLPGPPGDAGVSLHHDGPDHPPAQLSEDKPGC